MSKMRWAMILAVISVAMAGCASQYGVELPDSSPTNAVLADNDRDDGMPDYELPPGVDMTKALAEVVIASALRGYELLDVPGEPASQITMGKRETQRSPMGEYYTITTTMEFSGEQRMTGIMLRGRVFTQRSPDGSRIERTGDSLWSDDLDVILKAAAAQLWLESHHR